MRYNYCTAWHTAHLFAMLNAPREKWLCRCPIRWWLWWLSVKTISGPCLTYDEKKRKKRRKHSPATPTLVQRCLKNVCPCRSPLLPLISIVINFYLPSVPWLEAAVMSLAIASGVLRLGLYVYARLDAATTAVFSSAAVAVGYVNYRSMLQSIGIFFRFLGIAR